MSYETVEAALKTQLATIANLTVVLNDATKIQGGSQKVAILKYGRFSQERFSHGGDHMLTWEIEIELYCRYVNDADTRNNLRDVRNAVINRINAYPRLADASEVFDAFIVRGQKLPEAVTLGGAHYLGEQIICQVREELSVSYQE